MYREHPSFTDPENEQTKIWRYMDFTKFVSMLEMNSLFFVRADKLNDPFEGSYPLPNRGKRMEYYGTDETSPFIENYSFFAEKFRCLTLINCWHMNEVESDAMWKLYLMNNKGVAIQSNFTRLKSCFDKNLDNNIFIGKVNYIDYRKDSIPEGNSRSPFLYKRKSFDHERELRAVIFNKISNLFRPPQYDVGMHVSVDLDILIESISISPTSPLWFSDLVKSISAKYNVNKPIFQSLLSVEPNY